MRACVRACVRVHMREQQSLIIFCRHTGTTGISLVAHRNSTIFTRDGTVKVKSQGLSVFNYDLNEHLQLFANIFILAYFYDIVNLTLSMQVC